MHIKRGFGIYLAALFITLGIILVSSCGGGFTVTFVDTLRPPAKEPVKKKPPEPVVKEKPPATAEEPKVEEPKTEVVVSEKEQAAGEEDKETSAQEPKVTEAPEKSVSEETKPVEVAAEGPARTEGPEGTGEQEEAEGPEGIGDSTGEKPAVSEEQKQKSETVKNKEEVSKEKPSVEKGEEQKIAKEKEKKKTDENQKTKPPEIKKEVVTITGIVSLRKNTFYITELESKKLYKLVGLKKEDEAMLKKLIGKQADFELRIVSTEAKRAYNAQLVKIAEEKLDSKGEVEDTSPKKEKKK